MMVIKASIGNCYFYMLLLTFINILKYNIRAALVDIYYTYLHKAEWLSSI